ncbi:hypothetical protein H4R21_002668 [Coemansia helicoidea]|uniref:Uncharacterized protein n=1 Tax=Coemansia helicoidea TaxID=1286919 RepID=A0ACC1L6H8_9FUNG|nr:hypothetical protein H4R21_002668 [Coemansia helicoidea]
MGLGLRKLRIVGCPASCALLGKAGSHVERLRVIYDDTCAAEYAEILAGHLLLGNIRLRSLTLPVAHMDMAEALVEQHQLAAPLPSFTQAPPVAGGKRRDEGTVQFPSVNQGAAF